MGFRYIRVCSSPSDFRRQRVLFGSHQGLYSMWNVWESNTGNRTEFFCFPLIKIHDFLRRRFLFSLLPYRSFSVTWSAALQIGHFRVPPGLCLKTRLSAQPLIWKNFHSHANKTHFHNKGWALGLILKAGVFGTRKWPIAWNKRKF